MTGTEVQTLRIVAWRGPIDPAAVARSMGVSARHVSPLMRRLADSGHLEEAVEGSGYIITPKATQAIAPFAGRGRAESNALSTQQELTVQEGVL